MDISNVLDKWENRTDEFEPFWNALDKETDRGVAIISACLLDEFLERLIRSSYINDRRVKSLFKDDHILQSFFAKINITYFSGLIPNVFYHDLKLICEIRNKFAHGTTGNLRFTDKAILQRIDKFTQISEKTGAKFYPPRVRFILVVQNIVTILQVLERLVTKIGPPHLVEMLNLNKWPFSEMILTPAEIRNVLSKVTASSHDVNKTSTSPPKHTVPPQINEELTT